MADNQGAHPEQFEVIATGADRVTILKTGVTSEAVAIATPNATRRTLRINNLGDTCIWFGASLNTTPGTTGRNYGYLTPANNTEIEHYRGVVHAVVGASAVTVGVSSAGSSIAPCWVAVADIG